MQQFIFIIFGVFTVSTFFEFRKEFIKFSITIVQILCEMVYNACIHLTKLWKPKQ